jgi:hypothetical protein
MPFFGPEIFIKIFIPKAAFLIVFNIFCYRQPFFGSRKDLDDLKKDYFGQKTSF